VLHPQTCDPPAIEMAVIGSMFKIDQSRTLMMSAYFTYCRNPLSRIGAPAAQTLNAAVAASARGCWLRRPASASPTHIEALIEWIQIMSVKFTQTLSPALA